MTKVIKVNLNQKSVANAIKEIGEYQKEIENKARKLAELLVETGANIAKIKIIEFGAVDTGNLLSGVSGYFNSATNVGAIQVTSDHVMFVEFGTGIVGQSSPHPNGEYLSQAAWAYATGSHIFTTQSGRVGWYYPTDDGEFRFTEGMKARPFMYETAKELVTRFEFMAREVFK